MLPKLTIPSGSVSYEDDKNTVDLNHFLTDEWDELPEVEQRTRLMSLMQAISDITHDAVYLDSDEDTD